MCFWLGLFLVLGYASGFQQHADAGEANDKVINVVLVEQSLPTPVEVGKAFDYVIEITNLTSMSLEEFVVHGHLAPIFQFNSSVPATESAEAGQVQWKLGTLESGQSKVIQVNGTALELGEITNCATVTYKTKVCSTIHVIQPQLQLTKTAPAEVLLCDPIPLKLVVSNPGSGPAYNVKVEDVLPEGLVTTDGQTALMFDVGTLAPGAMREFTVDTKAMKTGTYLNQATAKADGNLSAEASTTTVVKQPVLAISKDGPKSRLIGRKLDYAIKLTNTGDGIAADTVLEDIVPSGTTFISASPGGEFVESAGKVIWNLGSLAPGDSRDLSLSLRADQFGVLRNTAAANAVCAKPVSAVVLTEIVGIPAILLEVIDVEDPIEIGSEETYVITATNQGTAPDTDIEIVCVLEDNMEYVSSLGATTGVHAAGTITFEPLATLAPKAKATWRVVVKALTPGDVRFKVTMNTGQLTREVEETEATHLFE